MSHARRIGDHPASLEYRIRQLQKRINELEKLAVRYNTPAAIAADFTQRLKYLHDAGILHTVYEVHVLAINAKPNADGTFNAWWTRTPSPDRFVFVEGNNRFGVAYSRSELEFSISQKEALLDKTSTAL